MIEAIDHVVITVSDIQRSVDFYTSVLKMDHRCFGEDRHALHFGHQKINLQTLGQESRNRARVGSGDLCLVANPSRTNVMAHLRKCHVEIIEGPVTRTGALGAMTSIYLLDPDRNLIELCWYDPT